VTGARREEKQSGPRRRRRPARRSGEQIVAAILDGAEQLLEAGAVEQITTNRIAALAGVSVGSLYQYFPNKEAIVRELALRLDRRALETAGAHVEAAAGRSLEEAARITARALLARELGSPRLRRALQLDVPGRWLEGANAATDDAIGALIAGVLAEREAEIRREGDRERMAFIIQHALEGVAEAAVARRPAYLEDDAFAEELAQLLFRFLRRE